MQEEGESKSSGERSQLRKAPGPSRERGGVSFPPSTPSCLGPYFLCPRGCQASKLVSRASVFLPFPNHPALHCQTSFSRPFPLPDASAIEPAMTPYFLLTDLSLFPRH